MNTVGGMDVYSKIKEISYSSKDSIKTISIDRITEELNGNKEIIREYVTALSLLELIKLADNENNIVIDNT